MYVLALDQGTTSSRAILFDHAGRIVASEAHEFTQHFPKPGWVEHDPEEIWDSQLRALRGTVSRAGIGFDEIAAIGITNQRETTVVWDRESGEPVYPAIVWQSRQTVPICEDLKRRGLESLFRDRTGLVVDAYFSGTKIRWILDEVAGVRERAARGELAFGTIDSWLIYKLTGGRVHATEYSNASRTLLYDVYKLRWDPELLEALDVPPTMLPEVRDSSGSFGDTDPELLDGTSLPISGVVGDQQAALFGLACFKPGSAKNTYGTGCFILMNTGTEPRRSETGLLTTIAWGIDGRIEYALEGSIFVAGAAVQWLRDQLGLISDASESEALAASVDDTGGVYLVPAFTGLGAPYWDPHARGTLVGLTRGSSRAHIVRATLEAIAYQTRDVLECFERDAGFQLRELQVDGGASANSFLMQFQADILGISVRRPSVAETTALGAAYLAGLAVGFWENQAQIAKNWQEDRRFDPRLAEDRREELYAGWKRAVERARGWLVE
ncbi:MAG: glycerol kinase GlpK [Deltaproteobacteria bacterium]|nr:glycerol kinase GlpK [Deltaproteobacteria bacterium]